MKTTILAIETATDACSAALLHADHLYSRFEITPKEHTQRILPMVRALLNEAHLSLEALDAIAVGRGPGSFTGVRIAMSVAQGLGFGLNIPLFPISTLEALALQMCEEIETEKAQDCLIVPAIDARMHEIYGAIFKPTPLQGVCMVHPEAVFSPESFTRILAEYSSKWIMAIGSGWAEYSAQMMQQPLKVHVFSKSAPDARHIAKLAQKQIQDGQKGISALQARPTYLRDKVAEKPAVPAPMIFNGVRE
jgi:tRNA threonylcarbamoyladenosine biosynthesis protein TsaB